MASTGPINVEQEKLIGSHPNAQALREAFNVLEQANIPFNDVNRDLYIAVKLFGIKIDKNNLSTGFEALNQANIPFATNRYLYRAVIENAKHAGKLSKGFEALNQANIPFATNRPLYRAVIANAKYADQLKAIFTALKEANILFADNYELYRIAIRAKNIDKLAAAIAALNQANIPLSDKRELYFLVIKDAWCADSLVAAFTTLNQANIPLADNGELYLTIIEYKNNADTLVAPIAALNQANIPLVDSELYLAVIKKAPYYKLDPAFEALVTLKNAGIAYAKNKSLYLSVLNDIENSEHLSEILSLMKTSGITYEQYPQFFNINTLFKCKEIVFTVFNRLKSSGFTIEAHPNVYIKLLEMITDRNGLSVIMSALNCVCDYANKKGLCNENKDNYKKQQATLDGMLNVSMIDSLARGPLNKSNETKQIEVLLEQLSQPQIFNNTEMSYRDKHYFIKLPSQDEINLSLLIKNANLSHLTLSNELIDKIGGILKPILKSWDETEKDNTIIGLLKPSQRAAFNLYKNYTYKNINALFRSEPLDESKSDWVVVNDANIDKIIHANFLLGCLVNDAANKINVLAEPVPAMSPSLIEEIGKLSSKKDDILDRKEDLTAEVLIRRNANPWSFPALTSFSLFQNGSQYIRATKDTHTKMDNGKGYNINQSEGEVVFPHGTQVVTKKIRDDYFVSTMVCSPTLERNHYWSDVALKHAWNNHLSHVYIEEQCIIQLDNVNVVRPNHGLAHTYRVMQSTELVANYFAQFANDNEFKAFCQSLTHTDQEWLRMAAAYSVTGRESEIAAVVDPEKYGRYRKASADNFEKFINTTELATETIAKETFSDVVHYMGHPDYESKINQHPDETERKRRNFFNRLLSTAHKIDLARCYDASKFSDCMQYYHDLSAQSPDQQKALYELIAYHIQVIKAHGNTLCCDIKLDGTLIDADIKYLPIFGEVSGSMTRLSEVTETVPRPQVLLPFQFPVQDNPKPEDAPNANEPKFIDAPTMLLKRKLEQPSKAKRLKKNLPEDMQSTEQPMQYELQKDYPYKRIIQNGNEQSSKRLQMNTENGPMYPRRRRNQA